MFLVDYLDAAMARPWAWGEHDCCHFAGDWVKEATGRDPLGPYRHRYASATEAGRLILRAGGLSVLLAAEMARCDFALVDEPETGDIAALPLPGETGPARASVVIANGPWWVGLTRDGIVGVRAEPRLVWSLGR